MKSMDKKTLRENFIRGHAGMAGEEARAKSAAISSLVTGSAFFRDAKVIFCYISVEGEPDTARIIEAAFADGKKVCVPRTGSRGGGVAHSRDVPFCASAGVDAQKGTSLLCATPPPRGMEAVPVDEPAYRNAGAEWPVVFGIPVPPPSFPSADPAEIDLVIVPSLAADIYGYRLGHGAGYYDRFISKCRGLQKQPVFAAIQFSEFVMDDPLPRLGHDQRVDFVITEKGVIFPSAPCPSTETPLP